MQITRRILVVTFVAFSVVASGCSSGNTTVAVDDSASPTTDSDRADDSADARADDAGDGTSDAGAASSAQRYDLEAELLATTADDSPFDLSGGATSDDTDVVIVANDPTADLDSSTIAVSSLWPTDWTRRTIDVGELFPGLRGQDPRDGIPPIDNPRFENVGQAGEWLSDNEPGALVRLDGQARFYPLSIMTAHEIVNDRFGDTPIAVTFCPLCNTAIAYDRRVDGEVLRFGVSGLLRNSDLVMWDDATTSLWQQISGEGVVGTYAGTQLEPISTAIVSFSQFRDSFPEGLSLSRETGLGRSYGINPYAGYSSLETPFLFAGEPDPRLPALSRVVGVLEDYGVKAYPFESLSESGVVNDSLNGEPITVWWVDGTTDALDKSSIADSASIGTAIAYRPIVNGETLTFSPADGETFTDAETGSTWSITGIALDGPLAGSELATVVHKNEFWFAFAGFYPEASVYGI